jgi:DNA-binding transcriptional LysR family regulator
MYNMNAMHIDQLDFTQVRLLAELWRSPNVSRAARRVGVSQSAASHAIARLRTKLGDILFIRTREGLKLTPRGTQVCEAACQAVETLTAALSSNQEFNPLSAVRVFRFFMNEIGQSVLLPPLLRYMKRNAPAASAHVMPVPLDDPGAALASGEADFAAGFFNNMTGGVYQSLVFRERYVCIVRSAHPKFRTGMNLESFTSAEHAIADATGMAHAVIDRNLARYRIRRNVTLRVPGLHVLPVIVANSDLIAVIPKRLADLFASRVQIKVLPPPVPMAAFDVCLYWHERYHHDPAIRWMRRAFVGLFADAR